MKMKKFVCLFVCLFAGSVNASLIINNSVTGSITNDFEGVLTGAVTGLLNQSGADYGELFTGQTLSTAGGFDSLSGTPTTSLNLEANAVASDNIGILSLGGSNIIYGDLSAGVGEGALSILLGNDTNIFGFDIVGANNGSFLIDFFSSNGNLLGSFSQSTSNSFFGFEVDSGSLIHAVSITNTDFDGLGYDNFTFNSVTTSVPEPASIVLLGLGLAGIGFSRKKKNT
jgi:hypothetical protein